MQFKLIAASIAALSVGSAMAGPLPAVVAENAIAARVAAPAAAPAPAPLPVALKARTENVAMIEIIQQAALIWAQTQDGTVASSEQVHRAQQWWPADVWTYDYHSCNDWSSGWDVTLWYEFYLYVNYPDYCDTWNVYYWPNDWYNYDDFCTPGCLC